MGGDVADVRQSGPEVPLGQLQLGVFATNEFFNCVRGAGACVGNASGCCYWSVKCAEEGSGSHSVLQLGVLATLRSVSRAHKPNITKGDEVRWFVRFGEQCSPIK